MHKAVVLDSNVFISSLKGNEKASADCTKLIECVENKNLILIEPTILLSEVIDAIGRNIDENYALKSEKILKDMVSIWVDCDINFCVNAGHLGYKHKIYGCDAIYAEVAKEYNVPMVSLDINEFVNRLKSNNFEAYSVEDFLKSI